MELGGQYVATALPMIQLRGTGPQKRLSSESPRLSPIRKYMPLGTVIVFRLHSAALQEDAKGSATCLPLRITWPLRIAMRSPGRPTTRLTNVVFECLAVGFVQACRVSGPPL